MLIRIKKIPPLRRFLLAVFILLFIALLFRGYNGVDSLSDDKSSGGDGLTGYARFIRDFIVFIIACSGLYIAGIRSHAADEQAKTANKQTETDSKRQSAETFAKSVELLASNNQDGEPAIESRIGGIYALEKLASADAENYAAPVMKMLVTYIRENAQKTALPVASKETDAKTTTDPDKRKKPAHLGEDVKTAFAALKSLHDNDSALDKSGLKREAPDELSFAYADFRALRMGEIKWIDKPNLRYAQLQDADLRLAKLQGADLECAQLQGADLFGARLRETKLTEAQLQGADLIETHLQDANLIKAQLQYAKLIKAKLKRARLNEAQLQGADFNRANLEDANLKKVQLQNVRHHDISEQTKDLQSSDKNTDDSQFRGVGYLGKPSFSSNEDESPQEDNKWNLESIWSLAPILKKMPREAQKFFLQGVLRNFAEKDEEKPTCWAQQCRQAVRKLQKSHSDLWDALDPEWTRWL